MTGFAKERDPSRETKAVGSVEPIRLGAFELRGLLDRGGMAEIWSGVHPAQQVPVAFKIVNRERARQPKFRAAFRHEVQAVARLNHPNIVMVLDHGEIPEAVEEASGGLILAGAPYLVMERLSGGTLWRSAAVNSWSSARATLLAILDALAYAHARGVIHRDLSPRNIALGTEDDLRPGFKLIDFGLARIAFGTDRPKEFIAGTPGFQAPEQVTHWRGADQGPWTDLFGVGCMAFYLACGHPPFSRESSKEGLSSLFTGPTPELRPLFRCPGGFEDWLGRLLRREPEQRFQSAAEAAWQLGEMGEDSAAYPAVILPDQQGAAAVTIDETPAQPTRTTMVTLSYLLADASHEILATPDVHLSNATTHPAVVRMERPYDGDVIDERIVQPVTPPLPTTWRRPNPPTHPVRLVGAGLKLHGLRAIPFVGRETERDQIWENLLDVERSGRAQVTLLRGPMGSGKTRLAQWIAQRANEVGCARSLLALHSPTPGHTTGVLGMFRSILECQPEFGLHDTAQRVARLQFRSSHFNRQDVNVLAELLTLPIKEDGRPKTAPNIAPGHRLAVFHRALRSIARGRPMVVVLDDVQWGHGALELVDHIVKAQDYSPSPIFFLLTAQDEALVENRRESEKLEKLLHISDSPQLSIGHLDRPEQKTLIDQMLLLDRRLARKVQSRTGGNPLFAVQLIGDWVQRGVLELGPSGFLLKTGEQAHLPDSIFSVWKDRIERLLDELTGDPQVRANHLGALEIAAALGPEVVADEWCDVCQLKGISFGDELVEHLLSNNLALPSDHGWTFIHRMLAESLLRQADEANRLQASHRVCAQMLSERGSPPDAERLAYHLEAGGNTEAALVPLLEAATKASQSGSSNKSLDLLDRYQELLGQIGCDQADQRWCESWLQRSIYLGRIAHHDEAVKWCQRAIVQSRKYAHERLLADALTQRAHLHLAQGQHDEARTQAHEAIVLAKSLNDRAILSKANRFVASALQFQGSFPDAYQFALKALQDAEKAEDPFLVANCLTTLAAVLGLLRRFEESFQIFDRSESIYESLNATPSLALAINDRGDMARMAGRPEEAMTQLKKAKELLDDVELFEIAGLPQINIGLCLNELGRFDEARASLEKALATFSVTGTRKHFLVCTHVLLLPSIVNARDWDAFDWHLEQVHPLLEQTQLAYPDVAEMAEMAGKMLRQVEQQDRALAALDMAGAQWAKLGDGDRETTVRKMIEELKATKS